MRLLIIRHGESQADLLDVHEGRADFELTEKGLAQAERLAAWVAERCQVDALLCSPLKRTRQTAERLARRLGLPLRTDELLMEFDNGLIAGMSRMEAAERYPHVPDLPPEKSLYGQESKLAFRNRAEQMLAKLLSSYDTDATIALVSHGGMINQLYHAFLGLPLASRHIFLTGDTGIHVWQIIGEKRQVVLANGHEHLGNYSEIISNHPSTNRGK